MYKKGLSDYIDFQISFGLLQRILGPKKKKPNFSLLDTLVDFGRVNSFGGPFRISCNTFSPG
jgi:hypothetical protein